MPRAATGSSSNRGAAVRPRQQALWPPRPPRRSLALRICRAAAMLDARGLSPGTRTRCTSTEGGESRHRQRTPGTSGERNATAAGSQNRQQPCTARPASDTSGTSDEKREKAAAPPNPLQP
eukprot:1541293-Rhodomonas_salina.1